MLVITVLIVSVCHFGAYGAYLYMQTKRNDRVFRYRLALLDKIIDALPQDGRSCDWTWQFDYYESVGYHEMVKKFWKKLDSFYPDKSFITAGAVKPTK